MNLYGIFSCEAVFVLQESYKSNLIFLSSLKMRSINKANKNTIKKNVEKIFKVNVTKVNIINKRSRQKITRGTKKIIVGFKKAIVTLKKGQNIDLTTGI